MITVLFSCAACGLVKEKAFVRSRLEGEDIVEWMKEVAEQVSAFHDLATSDPTCKPKTISEVYIPVSNEKDLGR